MRRPQNTIGHPATLSRGQPPGHCDDHSDFHGTLHIVGEVTRQSNGIKGSFPTLAAPPDLRDKMAHQRRVGVVAGRGGS